MSIKCSSAPIPFYNPVDRFVVDGYKDLAALPLDAIMPLMAEVEGLEPISLDYPLDFQDPVKVRELLDLNGLTLGCMDVGIYGHRKWAHGSFASHDPQIRREAVQVTKQAMDAAAELGLADLYVWPGQDGFEYAFQADHDLAWGYLLEGLTECAEHRPEIRLGIEYKAMEPRARSFIDTAATTLLLCERSGLPNLGVVIDIGHSFNAQEDPAQAVALCARFNRLFQIHVNDNYRNWDNDLLVGQVHFWQSLEFFYWLHHKGYDGYYDMDFFPYREDGKAALEQCIRSTRWLHDLACRLPQATIEALQRADDPVAISRLLWEQVIRMSRPASYLHVLDDDGLDRLHEQALQVLEDPGMQLGDPEMLAALAARGAGVDHSTGVARFPRALVEQTIEMARQDEIERLAGGHTEVDAPNALTFSWHTAYTERGGGVRISLGGGCPLCYDYPRQTARYATGADFRRLVHLAEGIPEIVTTGNPVHFITGDDGTAVPPSMVAIQGAATVATNSSKPGCTSIMDHRQLDYLMEIGRIVRGSPAAYIRRPIFVNISDTDSPLRVSPPEAKIMTAMARHGISIFILPMPLIGITGPVYPVVNAACAVAEILGVWTAAKALNERVPVEANCAAGALDPRSGAAVFVVPEAVLVDLAVAQLFRSRYRIRCGVTPGIIDAGVPGIAAIFERMLKMMACAAAGEPNYPAGILAAGRIFSPEQMMLDIEMAGACQMLAGGIDGENVDCAAALIREGGIGGLFMDTEHTARHFREYLWMPRVWTRSKSMDIAELLRDDPVRRAYERWNDILARTPMYTIDDDRRAAIEAVVQRAAGAL